MRILTIVHRLGIGGTERTVQNFVFEFQRLGHEVAVLTTLEGGEREPILRARGIPTYIGGLSDERLEPALVSADEFEPDVIHIHRSGTPNAHETRILRRLKTGSRRVVETSMFGRVDHTEGGSLIDLHCHVSRWNLWQWRKWMGKHANQVPAVMIPNPIDTDAFMRPRPHELREFRDANSIPSNAFVLGRIARRDPHMWHYSNLTAFESLAACDPDAFFLGIGIPDCIQRRISRMPAHIRDRVRDLSRTTKDDELCLILASMDGFLHANPYGETFGLALAEALLCDVPVITVSRPLRGNGHLELLDNGRVGMATRGFRDLSHVVTKFRKEENARREMARRARQFIVDNYDSAEISRLMLRAFSHVARSKRPVDLLDAVSADCKLLTTVSDEQIKELLGVVEGGHRWVERLASRLVFSPAGYRTYREIKSLWKILSERRN